MTSTIARLSTAAPLAGLAVTGSGALPAEVGVRHLRALGAVGLGAGGLGVGAAGLDAGGVGAGGLDAGGVGAVGLGVAARPSGLAGLLRLTGDVGQPVAVECSIAWAGPVRAPITDELSAQAACGIMQVHGRRYGRPVALGVDYASTLAGVLGVQGMLAVLVARLRGADLRRVTTSVAQAALLAVTQYLAAATAGDDWPEPEQPGGPPFTSADGVRFELETLDAGRWLRFWTLLAAEPRLVGQAWRSFQHRFATATCPLPHQLHRAAANHRYADVSAAAATAGVSLLPLQPPPATPCDRPPWRFTPLPGPGSDAALPGSSAMPSGSGTALPGSGAAPPGSGTALPGSGTAPPGSGTALPGSGAAPPGRVAASAATAPATRLPLDGLLVVEAGRRVQGPLAGHLLRLLGARVVRVEPPGGDPMRGMPPMAGDCSARFLALNRGKEVFEADLRSDGGRRAVRDIVAQADVFLHNWAPGRAAELALDAGDLAPVRPGLVYAHASGWGEEFGDRPPLGTDHLVQAHSGLAAMLAPPDSPATPSLMTITDLLGGAVCAQGVLAALVARHRTGRGQRVDTSLLSAATVLRPGTRPGPTVRPCTDLSRLAADPGFAAALERDGCTLPRAPWEFR